MIAHRKMSEDNRRDDAVGPAAEGEKGEGNCGQENGEQDGLGIGVSYPLFFLFCFFPAPWSKPVA